MRLSETRRFEMLARVRDFGMAHADLFSPTSVAAQSFAIVGAAVEDASADGVAETAYDRYARERAAVKARARDTLYSLMLALVRTARAVSVDDPGLDMKFRMPPTQTDQRHIAVARAMVGMAAAYADRFVAHEMPPTFLMDLSAAADALANAIQGHATAKAARAAAGARGVDAIAKGFAAARRLDAIAKNRFADNPPLLAAWNAARYVSKLRVTNPPAEQPAVRQAVKAA